MQKIVYWLFVILFLGSQLFFFSCRDEEISENPEFQLEFSVDTLRFDTVFTTIGSATRTLKVINPNSVAVIISNIELEKSGSSFFRLNVDGIPSKSATNVKIPAKDSIYIFAEVTIDPDMPLSISPFIIEERLLFNFNNEEQSVLLQAWGQNANYIPNTSSGGTFNLLSCDSRSISWSDPKPYVIYGILFIDSCELILPAGTEVYVHGGIANIDGTLINDGLIVVLENGSIKSDGNINNPVSINGDRLESEFDDLPGQWGGIRLTAGSKNNSFKYTTIKNSIVGIRADSSAELNLKNVQILNTAGSGLIGVQADIYGENCLVANNGNYSALFTYGGSYTFSYSTFANYGNQSSALRLDNFRCTDALCSGSVYVSPMVANFTNCIFSGSSDDEIEFADATEGNEPQFFSYSLSHCIVRVDELLNANAFPEFFDQCENCLNLEASDPLFINLDESDYHLDTMSVAIQIALPLSSISIDIEGNPRDVQMPDAGCFEFQD